MKAFYSNTKISEVPEDWKIVRIKDIISEYLPGFASGERDEKNGILQLRTNNISTSGKVNFDKTLYVPKTKKYEDYILKENDVLINNTNSYDLVGKTAIFNNHNEPCVFSNHISRLEADENKALSKWLTYWCIRLFERGVFKSLCNKHVNQVGLSKRDILTSLLPTPPIPEQQKIAEILSTVDESIENSDAIIKETQQLKKGLMQKLFTEGIGHRRFKKTKIGRVPEEWRVVMIKDICDVISSGIKMGDFKNAGRPDDFGNDVFVVYMKVSDMNRPGNEKYITDGVISGFFPVSFIKQSSVVPPMSIIFPKRGAAIKTNKKRISSKYTVLDPNLIAISPKDASQINSKFLFSYFENFDISQLQEDGPVPQLNKRDIEPLRVPAPEIREQNQIANIFDEIDAKIENEQNTKAELEQLKKGLIQILLTGKIRVKV